MQTESQAQVQMQADPVRAGHRLPADDIIDYTLSKMQARLYGTASQSGQERNGLLFTGNIHDAYPRALILDMRLSPLDKMCWIMIRQYALQNDGAIFPSYDELQKLLSSPGSGLASRDTVSRALTMLRLTGWLSLCKRVRDTGGRVRGNIYAQHDEPLSAKDAEVFDPGWLEMLGRACGHKYREVSETAWRVLEGILGDPMMRHRHSRLTEIAERLTRPSTARDVARIQQSPANGLSPGRAKNAQKSLSPDSRLSSEREDETPGSDNRLSNKSDAYDRVRQTDCNNVRSFTQEVIKKTYVDSAGATTPPSGGVPAGFVWPDGLQCLLPENEQAMLAVQLHHLRQKNAELADSVAVTVVSGVREGKINNPVAYLLVLLRHAREGRFRLPEGDLKAVAVPPSSPSAGVSRPLQTGELNGHDGGALEEAFVPVPKEVLAVKLTEARAALQVNR
ncbi:STY4528 family pathogenicity island replication protein [Salmonella enterica]|uniref:Helix-turn-helix domain-containing protein n=3 Tax=Salmonella enterica TaxID=28901 RepID=A0A7Z1PMZ6_SALET|nr:STY4528 family pathogenicity island replication protein [Salmonella enterica]EEJ6657309.1 helix-turn-helix domain-containing protein [Salmonella enterica subsp. enterica serovar Redlands]EAA8668616.1 helix-turn-helix domain-containing protein [Salmonella enterica]EAA9929192.1 helix-turn-helix domain-containing protein [Salmonella enterica]EAO9251890.1 helix-turn-helix domain-containing protein [Salmonella enterica]EAS2028871.1 helix-turn-helix domain-containing protein [Salmonella enterica]